MRKLFLNLICAILLVTAGCSSSKAVRESATIGGKGSLKDIDGNVYTTVMIGDLEWMVENLRVTRFRNGDPIATGLSNTEWAATDNGRLSAYAIYPYTETGGMVSSEAEMIEKYGLLYNGFAVEDAKGLAPEGWRVPTDEDFKNLERAIGMPEEILNKNGNRLVAGERFGLKLRGSTDWSVSGTDDVGFGALPTGFRDENGNYVHGISLGKDSRTSFWTSTESNNARNWRRLLISSHQDNVNRSSVFKKLGGSIRCVRDK